MEAGYPSPAHSKEQLFRRRRAVVLASLARGSHSTRRMSSHIRIADAVEIPPGKGKVVEVEGRQFTVFNCDGRFYASSTHAHRRTPAFDTSASCGGRAFDVHAQDSPARLRDEEPCLVRVDDDGIYLIVG